MTAIHDSSGNSRGAASSSSGFSRCPFTSGVGGVVVNVGKEGRNGDSSLAAGGPPGTQICRSVVMRGEVNCSLTVTRDEVGPGSVSAWEFLRATVKAAGSNWILESEWSLHSVEDNV